jgi:hypothetical protein
LNHKCWKQTLSPFPLQSTLLSFEEIAVAESVTTRRVAIIRHLFLQFKELLLLDFFETLEATEPQFPFLVLVYSPDA